MPKGMSKTGWVPTHPSKGVDWASIIFQEDRPSGRMARFTQWRWQRVILTLDDWDDPTPEQGSQK